MQHITYNSLWIDYFTVGKAVQILSRIYSKQKITQEAAGETYGLCQQWNLYSVQYH